MKYFKKDNHVYGFESDGSQDFLITDEYIQMTDSEIDQHINPQKYWTDAEKEENRLSRFTALTRRQFKLALLNNNLLSTVESSIESIEDATLKMRIKIEYEESERFERTSESVAYMLQMLNLSFEQVDAMWVEALKL